LTNAQTKETELLERIARLEEVAGNVEELDAKCKELTKENTAMQVEMDQFGTKFREEQLKRKALLNELEDMKGKIRVYCRIRPFSKTEKEDPSKYKDCYELIDEMSLLVHGRIDHHYNFDSVFGPTSTQEQVFDETKRLIQSAIDGYNVCIFAYGQTGSGKTFTIQGSEAMPGLTPRSIAELFALKKEMVQHNIKVSCYMVEIYKNHLYDLLIPKGFKGERPDLDIRKRADGQVVVKNVTMRDIEGYEQTYKVYEDGLRGRHTRATKMNEESSRSHLIFSIIISATNKQNGKKTEGKLSFIDLAGSESSKKTGLTKKDEGFEEARAINQSLSALGNVISALAEGSKGIIRYRENILTRLMEDSLGNNAKTLMFVNASPSVYNESETKNSLEYAKRVKEIKNNPTLNIETKNMAKFKVKLNAQAEVIDQLKGLLNENGLAE
jgi:hypothetical protein